MLAQSLFAPAVPTTPQVGDAPAADAADGAFGRMVEHAAREGTTPTAPTDAKGKPADGQGPQILPQIGARSVKPAENPLAPQVLPDVTASGDAETTDDTIDAALTDAPVDVANDEDVAAAPKAATEPQVLPAEVGPSPTPLPEVLPVLVQPKPTPTTPEASEETPPAPSTPNRIDAPLAVVASAEPALVGLEAKPERSPPIAGGIDDGPTSDAASTATAATPESAEITGRASTPADLKTPAPAPAPAAADVAPRATLDGVAAAPTPVAQPDVAAPTAAPVGAFGLSRVAHETLADLTAQVVRRLEAKVTRFDMALTPEDLGQVDVRLELADDGSLTARLHFDTPAAAAEMRAQADQLRRQLEQAGFQLARDALEFSHRDGSSSRQDGFERRPGRAFAAARDLTDAAEVAPLMNLSLSLGSARDRVDVKV